MMQEYKSQLTEQESTINSMREQTTSLLLENRRLKDELCALSISHSNLEKPGAGIENSGAAASGGSVVSAYLSAINNKKQQTTAAARPVTRSALAEKSNSSNNV
jgi:hypothetical protein